MNKENLLRMADYIETIPDSQFSMSHYRYSGDYKSYDCKTVGCVIGHCTILEQNRIPLYDDGNIDFNTWSEQFTGLVTGSDEWRWCFSFEWFNIDNTPAGAAKRIRWLVSNGLPKNWEKQMIGKAPLCYV